MGRARTRSSCLYENPSSGRPWTGAGASPGQAQDPKHHDEVLLYEERLSRSQRRRILAHIVCCADLYPLRLVTSLNRHFKQASLWVVARTGSVQQQRGAKLSNGSSSDDAETREIRTSKFLLII